MINTNKIIFTTKEEYYTFLDFWRTLAKSKKATSRDFLIYSLIQGTPLSKAFSPITNPIKLKHNCGGDKFHMIECLVYAFAVQLSYSKNEESIFGNWYKILPENIRATIKALMNNYWQMQGDTEKTIPFIEGRYSLQSLEIIEKSKEKSIPIQVTKPKSIIKKLFGGK
jgi:hypothetical protein